MLLLCRVRLGSGCVVESTEKVGKQQPVGLRVGESPLTARGTSGRRVFAFRVGGGDVCFPEYQIFVREKTAAKVEVKAPSTAPPQLQREHSAPKATVPARLPVRPSCRDALSMLYSRDLSLPHIREGKDVGLGVGHGKGCSLASKTPVVGNNQEKLPRWGDGHVMSWYRSDS